MRRVDRETGRITVVAGSGSDSFGGDGGPATSAALSNPMGVAVDAVGDVYISGALFFLSRSCPCHQRSWEVRLLAHTSTAYSCRRHL